MLSRQCCIKTEGIITKNAQKDFYEHIPYDGGFLDGKRAFKSAPILNRRPWYLPRTPAPSK
jgi:hypothetical protein